MADKDIGEENELINDTLDDERDEKRQEKAEAKAQRDNTIEKIKLADKILGKFGKNFLGPIKDFLLKVFQHVLPALGTILAAVVIIVVAVGLISFILNVPGLIGNKLGEAAAQITAYSRQLGWGDNSKLNGDVINKEERLKLLNYISSDMGFDVIGFGFVPVAVYDTGEGDDGESNIGKQKILDYETQLGYIDPIDSENGYGSTNPDNDLLYYYLMANERAYTKNENGSFWGKLGVTILNNFTYNPILDLYSPEMASLNFGYKNAWTGMLNIDEGGLIDKALIETNVDRESKRLSISINNPSLQNGLLNEDLFSYSLADWTGRYGMPLEFSLALHISTMSSGLVKEMITNPNLQAHVYINMLRCTCDLNFRFTMANGEELPIPYKTPEGTDENTLLNILFEVENAKEPEDIENLYTEFKDKISIIGLVNAANHVENTYILDESKIASGTMPGISREVGAIDAILGTTDFCVKTQGDGREYQYHADENTNNYLNNGRLAVFRRDGDQLDTNVLPQDADVNYRISSGAFICTYNADGSVNDSTGRLGAVQTFTNEDYVGKIYYEQTEKGDGYAVYSAFGTINKNNEGYEKVALGGDFCVPLNGSKVGILFDQGYGDKKYTRATGLGAFFGTDDVSTLDDYDVTDVSIADEVWLNRVAFEDHDAYKEMFMEIDNFLGIINVSELAFYGAYQPAGVCNDRAPDPNGFSCYTTWYYDFCDLVEEGDYANAKMTLWNILYNLEIARQSLREDSEKLQKTYAEVVDNAFKELGCGDVDMETLRQVIELFCGNGDLHNGEIEYTQPYITEVTRHWFKDVIFDGVEGFDSVYEPSDATFCIPYTGEDFNGRFQVQAELTPMEGQFYYTQPAKNQPHVVKGDLVLKDGKKVTQLEEANRIESKNDKGYHYGDGYRTTKKLFTQGQYYVFDGSAETARSIFWQQQMENMPNGTTVRVVVKNKKVYHVTGDSIDSGDTTVVKNEEEDGIPVVYENHILTINDLQYLSPADNDEETVNERVKHINETWESIGVDCFRQPVSFDNTTRTGEVIANTGLSILKNCGTKESEVIYRDLKEMLIDLGYYTEAEFDQLDVKLKWFMPRYNPKQWPQNTTEDLTFGAVLNPREEGEDGNSAKSSSGGTNGGSTNSGNSVEEPEEFVPFRGGTLNRETEKKSNDSTQNDENQSSSNEESNNNSSNSEISSYTKYSKEKGFRSDLKIIAPGACTVTDVDGDTIEIEFDGVRQPSISAMHKYKMTITGITPVASVGAQLSEGDELARTGTTQIKVFLKNDLGRTLSNVSDYMSPKKAGNQPYEFTDDEIVLLAYVINHEAAPEGLQGQMQYEIDRGYIVSYEDSWSAALAFAEAVGYVLTNRTLLNYGGFGSTIEEQTTAPGQYDGSFTIDYALAHEGSISAGSMEAALAVAESDCDIILKPDDPNVTMTRDVTGESAWQFGHQIFWWLDMVRDGEMADYPTNPGAPGYPTAANWPWDGFLTYSY